MDDEHLAKLLVYGELTIRLWHGGKLLKWYKDLIKSNKSAAGIPLSR